MTIERPGGFAAVLAWCCFVGVALTGCADLKRAAGEVDTALERAGDAIVGGDSERLAEARTLKAQGREAEAAALFRDAAEDGNAAAATELAIAYETGAGVPRDLEAAARWYNRGADGGDPRAQVVVGRGHESGGDRAADPVRAARYYARAAEQGYAPGQYRLGRAFANGVGVVQDRLWAARWYGKAARQGQRDAQFALGALLAAGRGVPQDKALAHAYLSAAEAGGIAAARTVLDALESRMSAVERRRAETLRIAIAAETTPRFADPPTVRYVQAGLARLGIDAGPVDGVMGPRTAEGIRSFQRRREVTADGKLDAGLLQALLEAVRAG